MQDSIYIVTGIDTDIQEKFEYEESTLSKAIEIYGVLKTQDDINSLVVLEYNLLKQQYHMIEI
jgi:hypothetical protein